MIQHDCPDEFFDLKDTKSAHCGRFNPPYPSANIELLILVLSEQFDLNVTVIHSSTCMKCFNFPPPKNLNATLLQSPSPVGPLLLPSRSYLAILWPAKKNRRKTHNVAAYTSYTSLKYPNLYIKCTTMVYLLYICLMNNVSHTELRKLWTVEDPSTVVVGS